MSGDERLVAAMWGTTNLQAFKLSPGAAAGAVRVESVRHGPGASRLPRDRFEDTFFELVGDWLADDWLADESPSGLPIVMAGMVGSTLGWQDVGYGTCPMAPDDAGLSEGFTARGRSIHIVRGLACTNVFGEPDVLRGEETEIAGWLRLCPEARDGERLACVPGTHAKWVRLRDGKIVDFLTSVAGEVFAGLCANGVLLDGEAEPPPAPDAVFLDAVRAAGRDGASLLHQLFSVRAKRVTGWEDAAAAAQRLSGLIVGADVAGALQLLAAAERRAPVTVIGAPAVAGRYAAALGELGVRCDCFDAETAAANGLWAMAKSIQKSNHRSIKGGTE